MNPRFVAISLVVTLLNIAVLYIFPISLLYHLMGILGGTNLVLNGVLSILCVSVFYRYNKGIFNDIVRNFNYYLVYIITNGSIAMLAPTKEDYFKLLDEQNKLSKESSFIKENKDEEEK